MESALEEKLNHFKQSGTSLYDILNAEKIGDAIGTGTLVELEEKLSVYQTALLNLKVGSEDYVRLQGKVLSMENLIQTAREKNTKKPRMNTSTEEITAT